MLELVKVHAWFDPYKIENAQGEIYGHHFYWHLAFSEGNLYNFKKASAFLYWGFYEKGTSATCVHYG